MYERVLLGHTVSCGARACSADEHFLFFARLRSMRIRLCSVYGALEFEFIQCNAHTTRVYFLIYHNDRAWFVIEKIIGDL